MQIDLLIIDPQNDFCEPTGSLFVQGADEDSKRLADFINKIGPKLNNIHVTLDTHHFVDVAHPIFWRNKEGHNPDPFTIITVDDVDKGVWIPSHPTFMDRGKAYVHELAKNNRYQLCIWPPHCLIGSPGHNVQSDIYAALLNWENRPSMVHYVTKGSNLWTEHYSAVMADVPDPADPTTQLNTQLIKMLQDKDMILLAGQARSHCLANTVRDIADNFGDDNIKKLILLEDATSDVTGFEILGDQFVKDMTARGMQISKTTDFVV